MARQLFIWLFLCFIVPALVWTALSALDALPRPQPVWSEPWSPDRAA